MLVVVTLFATFSITVNAEQQEIPDYYGVHSISLINNISGAKVNIGHEVNIFNGSKDYGNLEDYWLVDSSDYTFITSYRFLTDDPPLISKGGEAVVTMFEGYYGYGFKNVNTGQFSYSRSVDYVRLLITYTNDTSVYIDDVEYTLKDNKITLSSSFVPENDVKSIEYLVYQNTTLAPPFLVSLYLGEQFGADKGFSLSVNQETEEVGLLKSVINWLSGIKDGITDLFESIKELPSKLWQLISDGLKSLFVPDEEYISNYKDKWDSLLSSRFGVLYQVGSVIFEFGGNIVDILSTEPVDTIPFPYVSLDDVGIPFRFGGYLVDIVPDGFEFIVEAFQLVAVLSAILLTFNALRKRYDNIMGGGS